VGGGAVVHLDFDLQALDAIIQNGAADDRAPEQDFVNARSL